MDRSKMVAVLGVLILIGFAIYALTHRYEMKVGNGSIIRFDRLTGTILLCDGTGCTDLTDPKSEEILRLDPQPSTNPLTEALEREDAEKARR